MEKNRNCSMQAIFNELSEKNKDIVILLAKSIKVAQSIEKPFLNNDIEVEKEDT